MRTLIAVARATRVRIARSEYTVDPHGVAEALLRRTVLLPPWRSRFDQYEKCGRS